MFRIRLQLVMVIMCLVALLIGACKSEPAPAEGLEVNNAGDARNAVLDYLHEQKVQGVPGDEADWQETDITPEGLVGKTTKMFTFAGWTATVSYLVLPLEHTQYGVVLASIPLGWRWEGSVNADGTVNELGPITQMTEKGSQAIANDFVRQSLTFAFDGMAETLELKGTLTARCPYCWVFVYEFDCRQAGYGNRTGMMLAQVITHHRAVISVDQYEVVTAVMDDVWDMLTQTEIKE